MLYYLTFMAGLVLGWVLAHAMRAAGEYDRAIEREHADYRGSIRDEAKGGPL